jgi:deferrochelatase/peroxidase EfeB
MSGITSATRPPVEPVLDMDDIQGIAMPGFLKPHQTLLYLTLPANSREVLDNFKAWLARVSGSVASAAETLADRRQNRAIRLARAGAGEKPNVVLIAIGFSSIGLLKLTPGAAEVPDEAFQHGLVARSALLGDPIDPANPGHPSQWVVGAKGSELDALVVVAGDARPEVSAAAARLMTELRAAGVNVGSEDGDVREDDPGHEHFGFDDGVSQPGPRGRASDRPDDYITDRHIATRMTFLGPGSTVIQARTSYGQVNSYSVIRPAAPTR